MEEMTRGCAITKAVCAYCAFKPNSKRKDNFHKFASRLREAFEDLSDDEGSRLSEEQKVIKLLNAFKVPGMEHVKSLIAVAPTLRRNFNNAVAEIQNQLQTTRGGSQNCSRLTPMVGNQMGQMAASCLIPTTY